VTRFSLEPGQLLGHRRGGDLELVGGREHPAVPRYGEQETQASWVELHLSDAKAQVNQSAIALTTGTGQH
jgi:hypothetical protein